MLAVSNAFNEAFKSDLREVKMRIKVNDVTYTDEDIVSFNYNAGSIVGESFAIGSTYANSIKLTLCKIVEGLKQLDEVKPEMGIVLPNGSTEWVKLGTFIISEEVNPDRNENRTSLECTDKMIMLDDIYESKLNYPAKIKDVALEIANLAGVEVDKVSFGRLMENTIQNPVGYTYRQAIGLIAQFEAGYACFDRNGLLAIRQLEDKDYKVTPNEYFQNGLTKNELKFRPAGIQVKVSDSSEDDKVLKIGNEKGSVIRLENKVMTEQLLRLVYEKVKDINYYPYSLKWRGNPAVEVGDWLLVDDTRGNMFKVPNLSYSMEYKGGLTATSTVETVASNEVRFGYKKILDQVVELVENSIKDLDGNVIYYGVEEPPNPKDGDTWFKYVDSDTEIWVYEKVAEPDVFDWVFKISSAVDETIKEKIEQLEESSKQQQLDIEEALSESTLARKEAFDSTVISRQAERDALNALAQGDKNKTEITKLDGQQKLTNTKVEGNTANILSLQSDSERLSLSLGKVQSDVDGIADGGYNYLLKGDNPHNGQWYASGQSDGMITIARNVIDGHNVIEFKKHVANSGWSFFNNSKSLIVRPLELLTNKQWGLTLRINSNMKTKFDAKISDPSGPNLSIRFKEIELDVGWQTITMQSDMVDSTVNNDNNVLFFGANKWPAGVVLSLDWIVLRPNITSLKQWVPSMSETFSYSEFATFEANYKGFQQTVKSDISGLESQQTQMAGQITQTVEKVDNLQNGPRNYSFNLSAHTPYNTVYKRSENSRDWETTLTHQNNNMDTYFTMNRPGLNLKKDDLYILSGQILLDGKFAPVDWINNNQGQTYFGAKVGDLIIREDGTFRYIVRPNGASNWIFHCKITPKYIKAKGQKEIVTFKDLVISKGNIINDWSAPPEDLAEKSQITQLYDQLNLRVEKANVIAQINLSPEQVLIQAKRIHLSGESLIDNAVIKSAHIQDGSITNVKIQDAAIDSAKIISVDANKINAQTLQSITSNTGQLNVTGWLDFQTENRGLRGSYDFGDPYNNAYNFRWFDGDFRLSHRHLLYAGNIHNVNSNNTKGTKIGNAETYYGLDYAKFRAWDVRGNMTGRVDLTANYLTMSNSFDETSNVVINPNGDAFFRGQLALANDIVMRAQKSIFTFNVQSLESGQNIYFNYSRTDLADFRIGRDGSNINGGRVIQSLAIYNRTYSGPANMVVYDTGTIGRTTSARKYKLDIQTADDVVASAKKVLQIKPAHWLDKGEVGDGRVKQRYYGFIADEFDALGLNQVVIYNERKEVESLAYDRISMYHNVILTEHEDRLKRLERMLIGK